MTKLSRWTGFWAGSMLAIAAATASTTAAAQAPAVKVHGHVNNPAGQPLKVGDIKLTTDLKAEPKDRVYKYTFPLDANGDFKSTGEVLPGDYLIIISAENKTLDYQNITLRVGDDKTVNFDMSREEYLKSMTPAERTALEEYKKRNAATTEENGKIANINKTLLQARDDQKNGKPDEAVKALKPLTEAKPDEPVLWASLGEAQLALGDQMTKAARAAKTPTSDPAIIQNYTDAGASFQKALELNKTAKKPAPPENVAAYYLNLGQALSKSGNIPDASVAYDTAAKTAPTMAASAYYNEAVIFYSANKLPEAGAAAEKAIAADPKRAEPYYIKAQSLIPGAKEDPATHKFVLPPGCLEAYQEYLELKPDGQYAAEVKELLTGLGQPVKNSFKAGKK